MKKLRVVWGAPCSGKTTYCEKNLQGHDVVWDWDAVKRALIYGQDHERVDFIIDLLFKLRGAYLRAVKEDDNIDDAFIIVSFLDDKMRKFIEEDVGIEDVEYHLVEATVEECLERLKNDDTRPDKELEAKRIEEWFDTYGEKSEERSAIMKRKRDTREYRSLLLNLDTKDTEKRIDSDHYVEGYATADDAMAGTNPGSWLHDDKVVSSSTGSTTSTGTPYINDAADYERWYPAVSIWWMPSTGGSGYSIGWVNDDLNGFALWAKVAGSLRQNKAVYVKSGGTLRKAKAVYAKVDGTLRKAK